MRKHTLGNNAKRRPWVEMLASPRSTIAPCLQKNDSSLYAVNGERRLQGHAIDCSLLKDLNHCIPRTKKPSLLVYMCVLVIMRSPRNNPDGSHLPTLEGKHRTTWT